VNDPRRPDHEVGAARLGAVSESVIREMTREAHRHDAINLSQGIPDVDEAPQSIKEAAKTAVDARANTPSRGATGPPRRGRRPMR